MTSDLILHYAPDNASLCVRLALEEAGIPYQTRLVDRALHAQKSPEYLRLNPNGLIPTLETPQGVMFETGAILLWLADQYPGTMFPAPDAIDRGVALTRLFWLANTFHPTLRMIFYPSVYAPSSENTLTKNAKIRLETYLHQICTYISESEAEMPLLLKCYLAPMLRWCALYGDDTTWFNVNHWPPLLSLAATFETRPAAIRAATAEGLGPTPFSAPSLPQPPEGSAT